MKNIKLKNILAVTTASAAMMGVTTALNNASTVRADAVNDSTEVNTNAQTKSDDDIVTGTWGTAPWTWDKTTEVITVNAGDASQASVSEAPWRQSNNYYAIKEINFKGKVILPKDCSNLFKSLSKIESLDTSNLDSSNVTNMDNMFNDLRKLKTLNLDNFDTSKVTNMKSAFDSDRALTSLNLKSFDTSKVTNMTSMFTTCNALTSLDLSNFDTSNVTQMNDMFSYTVMKNLNISSFNTSKVTNMSNMFDNSTGLTDLDLSNFDTKNVTNMNRMFANMSSLNELNISNFDMTKVTDTGLMMTQIVPKTLIMGNKNKFPQDPLLQPVPTSDGYVGKWQNTRDPEGNNANNSKLYTSSELTANYTPELAGTYVWAKSGIITSKPVYTMTVGDPTPKGSDFGVSGLDKDGNPINPEYVVVDLVGANLSKPGTYDILLTYDGLAPVTVKVTVKEKTTNGGGGGNGGNENTVQAKELKQTVAVPSNTDEVPLYAIYGNKVTTVKNRALGRNSDWVSDKIITIDGTSYLRVADNEWVKATEVYRYENSSSIVRIKGNVPYVLLKNAQNETVSNRGLAPNTDWKTDKVAYLETGADTKSTNTNSQKYYRVASNEFVSSNDVM